MIEPAGQRLADRAQHLLGAPHHAVVVGVRLVELELRELRVVLEADALVAEVAADLVDALEAADQQALEVQLEADAQEQLLVELVVVRGERPGRRAAVDRLQNRASRPRGSRCRPGSGGWRRRAGCACGRRRAPLGWPAGRHNAGGSASRRPSARATCRAGGSASWTSSASSRTSHVTSPVRVVNMRPVTSMKSPRSISFLKSPS